MYLEGFSMEQSQFVFDLLVNIFGVGVLIGVAVTLILYVLFRYVLK